MAAVNYEEPYFINPITEGEDAPHWIAPACINERDQKCSPDLFFKKSRYIIMLFYPLNFYHATQALLLIFSSRIEEFKKCGATVLGISGNSIVAHVEWAKRPLEQGGVKGITFPLVSDLTRAISRLYGVHDEVNHLCVRSVYIIDDNDKVRYFLADDTMHDATMCDRTLIRLKEIRQADREARGLR